MAAAHPILRIPRLADYAALSAACIDDEHDDELQTRLFGTRRHHHHHDRSGSRGAAVAAGHSTTSGIERAATDIPRTHSRNEPRGNASDSDVNNHYVAARLLTEYRRSHWYREQLAGLQRFVGRCLDYCIAENESDGEGFGGGEAARRMPGAAAGSIPSVGNPIRSVPPDVVHAWLQRAVNRALSLAPYAIARPGPNGEAAAFSAGDKEMIPSTRGDSAAAQHPHLTHHDADINSSYIHPLQLPLRRSVPRAVQHMLPLHRDLAEAHCLTADCHDAAQSRLHQLRQVLHASPSPSKPQSSTSTEASRTQLQQPSEIRVDDDAHHHPGSASGSGARSGPPPRPAHPHKYDHRHGHASVSTDIDAGAVPSEAADLLYNHFESALMSRLYAVSFPSSCLSAERRDDHDHDDAVDVDAGAMEQGLRCLDARRLSQTLHLQHQTSTSSGAGNATLAAIGNVNVISSADSVSEHVHVQHDGTGQTLVPVPSSGSWMASLAASLHVPTQAMHPVPLRLAYACLQRMNRCVSPGSKMGCIADACDMMMRAMRIGRGQGGTTSESLLKTEQTGGTADDDSGDEGTASEREQTDRDVGADDQEEEEEDLNSTSDSGDADQREQGNVERDGPFLGPQNDGITPSSPAGSRSDDPAQKNQQHPTRSAGADALLPALMWLVLFCYGHVDAERDCNERGEAVVVTVTTTATATVAASTGSTPASQAQAEPGLHLRPDPSLLRLVQHCAYIERYRPASRIRGRGGYAFVQLHSCIHYLSSLALEQQRTMEQAPVQANSSDA